MSTKPAKKNPPTPKAIAMGERIRTQREHLGFTQSKLASMIGVSENAITQYETGRSSPRRERIGALAQALGKSIGWLLTGNEPEEEVKAQTEAERDVLNAMRDLPPEQQDFIVKMIQGLKK
ncbi:helix-turn-helix domain-containing protein [Acetobacter senegalensis]|uniref:helix-turn-helix domain-containing protein n=1 Tax=Acetobacter senegalensis TaxID=446692 RepID=UPI00264EE35A|nr:helix-turn-helix transcriptional regulator [Acetobacter senegalensis]MDN7350458.1 helix-turn-helix transcriptional regulator [Acetobacter senegalensis]